MFAFARSMPELRRLRCIGPSCERLLSRRTAVADLSALAALTVAALHRPCVRWSMPTCASYGIHAAGTAALPTRLTHLDLYGNVLVSPRTLDNLCSLGLADCGLAEGAAAALPALTALTRLGLSDNNMGDDDVHAVAALPGLVSLAMCGKQACAGSRLEQDRDNDKASK